MPPVAIYFYDVVLSLHIASIVVAFGLVFAYPVVVMTLQRQAPRAMAGYHAASLATIRYILTPAATVAFLAGAYLASDRDYWSEVWVTIPLIVLFAVLGIAHGFLAPRERQAAELAARDAGGATADGPVRWSPEYEAVVRQLGLGAAVIGGSVLVAIFFMTTKLGA